MSIRTINVGSKNGTPLISAGDGPTLIANTDINNTLWIGSDASISPTSNDIIDLSPQSFLLMDGEDDVYGVCNPGQTAAVHIIPGGLGFFQSGITSGGFKINNQGLFLYSGTPAFGNLFASIAAVAGTDPYGNPYPAGFSINAGAPGTGNTVYIQSAQPVSPNVGDIWFNTTAGKDTQLTRWNGTIWTAFTFGTGAITAGSITSALIAANTIVAGDIAANTITAGQIAANTITAAELAAGIVYAGIVDATTITGVTVSASVFNGTNYIERANGAWWYSSTPAAGNLVASITDASRTDGFGNVTPAGGGFCTYDNAGGNACQYAKNGITFYTGSLGGGWVAAPNSTIKFNGTGIDINAGGPITIGGIIEADLLYVGINQQLHAGSLAAPTTSAGQIECDGAIALKGRAAPGSPPAGYGYLYVNSGTGALHYKGTATDTTIAPA